MNICIDYTKAKKVCRSINAMDVLSCLVFNKFDMHNRRHREVLNELLPKCVSGVTGASKDINNCLPIGNVMTKSIPIEVLVREEYVSTKVASMLANGTREIAPLLSLRKTLLTMGVKLLLPRGYKNVRSGDELEPFYMEGYGVEPITGCIITVSGSPVSANVEGMSRENIHKLLSICKREGLTALAALKENEVCSLR